jgi:hypothetical protein
MFQQFSKRFDHFDLKFDKLDSKFIEFNAPFLNLEERKSGRITLTKPAEKRKIL